MHYTLLLTPGQLREDTPSPSGEQGRQKTGRQPSSTTVTGAEGLPLKQIGFRLPKTITRLEPLKCSNCGVEGHISVSKKCLRHLTTPATAPAVPGSGSPAFSPGAAAAPEPDSTVFASSTPLPTTADGKAMLSRQCSRCHSIGHIGSSKACPRRPDNSKSLKTAANSRTAKISVPLTPSTTIPKASQPALVATPHMATERRRPRKHYDPLRDELPEFRLDTDSSAPLLMAFTNSGTAPLPIGLKQPPHYIEFQLPDEIQKSALVCGDFIFQPHHKTYSEGISVTAELPWTKDHEKSLNLVVAELRRTQIMPPGDYRCWRSSLDHGPSHVIELSMGQFVVLVPITEDECSLELSGRVNIEVLWPVGRALILGEGMSYSPTKRRKYYSVIFFLHSS
ncbi:hypothetical protein B0I35DRAFT_196011 [Stachybotrys elegans]|uniref:Uncharacterized protein n=1 Tax=Stachybotrys elegans TaxID=80388 RepID=A0A8K0WJJ1_9HYPO|nr:hypothetical protein B0I35DRAFT_196011 [Stachybotrys elegans]